MRKYLNDIGVPDTLVKVDLNDTRWEAWNKQIAEYGFPVYETWCLDYVFYGWLYERLKMYLEANCVDLSYHKFEYNGREYTQKELIDKMLHGCELALFEENEHKHLTDEEKKIVDDVRWIWATVMPAMWW